MNRNRCRRLSGRGVARAAFRSARVPEASAQSAESSRIRLPRCLSRERTASGSSAKYYSMPAAVSGSSLVPSSAAITVALLG